MISTLSLLPIAMSTWASATPITIADVNAAREGGRMVVDISADAMVDPEFGQTALDVTMSSAAQA